LLDHGATLNLKMSSCKYSCDGLTALTRAISHGNVDVVKKLLDLGAKPNEREYHPSKHGLSLNMTPIEYVFWHTYFLDNRSKCEIARDRQLIASYLVDAGANIHVKPLCYPYKSLFQTTIEHGDFCGAQILVSYKVDYYYFKFHKLEFNIFSDIYESKSKQQIKENLLEDLPIENPNEIVDISTGQTRLMLAQQRGEEYRVKYFLQQLNKE
jgi:ankyrin repeat protein